MGEQKHVLVIGTSTTFGNVARMNHRVDVLPNLICRRPRQIERVGVDFEQVRVLSDLAPYAKAALPMEFQREILLMSASYYVFRFDLTRNANLTEFHSDQSKVLSTISMIPVHIALAGESG